MPKRWLRTLLVGAGLVAVAVGGYLFVNKRPLRVETARIEQNVPVRVFGLGTVEARILAKVGFEVGGAVVALNADHGDMVKKGDVLARLNSGAQSAKMRKAEAALNSVDASIKKAEANLEKARAVLAQRQEANRRKQELVTRRVVSDQSAEESQRDEEVAKGDLAVAASEVDVAKAQSADARAQFAFERAILDQHVLIAPFDAMVVDRQKELGTVIKAGDPMFTLVDPASIWALAYIDESRSGKIETGQPAEVRLRSLPQQTMRARVIRIGIESDRVSEERRVYVKCEQCPTRLHLGEQAEILVTVAQLATALLVPEAAVSGFDGRQGTVWTVEDGSLRRRMLSFGHRTEDAMLEVVGGLPAGGQVVSAITSGLREGRAATIDAGAPR